MSSPVQNGISNRPKFSDGQGLLYSDLNGIGDNARAYLNDIVLGTIMRYSQSDIGPKVGSSAQLYALGHSGAPRNVAAANSIGCNPGPLFYVPTGAVVDGNTPKVLMYYLQQNEITATFAVGDATNPRFDAVYVRISAIDGATGTRDFQDAVTGVVTTQSIVTQQQTKLEWVVVQGTPAAKPQVPAAPDSTWASWGVWWIPKAWNATYQGMYGTLAPPNLFDYRIPVGYKRYYNGVGQMYGIGSQVQWSGANGYATFTAAGATGTLAAQCAVHSGRVMGYAWNAPASSAPTALQRIIVVSQVGASVSMDMPWFRSIYGGNKAGDPTIGATELDNYSLSGGIWYDFFQNPVTTTTSGLALLPIWANGWGSEAEDPSQVGGMGLIGGEDSSYVIIEWVPGATTDKVMAGVFDIAG